MSSDDETVHLVAPKASEFEGVNVYCPVKKEFTQLFMGKSVDGLETYACLACYEPEPVYREMTQEELVAIVEQLNDNA